MTEFKGITIAALAVLALASPAAAAWNGAHMHDSLGMWESYQAEAQAQAGHYTLYVAPAPAPSANKDAYDNISGPRGVGWTY